MVIEGEVVHEEVWQARQVVGLAVVLAEQVVVVVDAGLGGRREGLEVETDVGVGMGVVMVEVSVVEEGGRGQGEGEVYRVVG